jgi:hypothetical protein
MIRSSVSRAILAVSLLLGGSIAFASENHESVPQMAAIATDLGHDASALTYWVDQADGWHVVTTVDTAVGDDRQAGPGRHAVVRFSALILPGQSQVISVPGSPGSTARALRIRRLGDRIEVTLVPQPDAASAHAIRSDKVSG